MGCLLEINLGSPRVMLQSSGKTALETGTVYPFNKLTYICSLCFSRCFTLLHFFRDISFKIKASLDLGLVGCKSGEHVCGAM